MPVVRDGGACTGGVRVYGGVHGYTHRYTPLYTVILSFTQLHAVIDSVLRRY